MFHHSVALNGLILKGASEIYNKYGGYTIPDLLDIEWYKDKDWAWAFGEIVKDINNDKPRKVWGANSEYEISLDNRTYVIVNTEKDSEVARIPSYSANDLFIFITTLLDGHLED